MQTCPNCLEKLNIHAEGTYCPGCGRETREHQEVPALPAQAKVIQLKSAPKKRNPPLSKAEKRMKKMSR